MHPKTKKPKQPRPTPLAPLAAALAAVHHVYVIEIEPAVIESLRHLLVNSPHGPAMTLEQAQRLLEQIDALKAEMATRNRQLVLDGLSPLVRDILTVMTPGDDDPRIAGLRRILADLRHRDVIRLGGRYDRKTDRAMRREAKAMLQVGGVLEGAIESALPEAMASWLYLPCWAALREPVHLGDSIRETIGRNFTSSVRNLLRGPGHRYRVGQARGVGGRSAGYIVEVHRDGPRNYRGGVTRRRIEAAGPDGTAAPTPSEIEDQVHARIELRRRLPELLAGAHGTPAELAVGMAFVLHMGDVEEAADSLGKNPTTFRVLLGRLKRRNPGRLANLLAPGAWKK